MSIEMENPQAPIELLDAATNHIGQAILASRMNDRGHVESALEAAQRLLFRLQNESAIDWHAVEVDTE